MKRQNTAYLNLVGASSAREYELNLQQGVGVSYVCNTCLPEASAQPG